MFGKRKSDRPKRDHTGKNLAQYGLFDMPTDLDGGMDDMDNDDENDSDLEAELAAISGGGAKPRRPARKKPVPQGELDAMVAESLRDIPSDEDLSVDEDDPELLSELQGIAGGEVEESEPVSEETPTENVSNDIIPVLEKRLKMYVDAETAAKEANESGKARRYNRGQKTIKDLLKQANAGQAINPEDIPPEVQYVAPKPVVETPEIPTSPVEPVIEPSEPVIEPSPVETPTEPVAPDPNSELLTMLAKRMKQYKIAALTAKKSGDTETALKYVRIAKQFEAVIGAVQAGQPVDLSKMPGPPGEETPQTSPPTENVEQNQVQTSSEPEPGLIEAGSVLEALEQRLAVYKEQEEKAKQEENAGKARRYGRIVKQFQDAIKLHKAGKPIPVDELPTPPGYGPIPVDGAKKPAPVAPQAPKAAPPTLPSPTSSRSSGAMTRTEKQYAILLAKQKQFKEAALAAKKKGEIPQAKEYLRQAKGFDKLLEAAMAGLPVDWASIPVSPEAKTHLDNDYDVITPDDCSEGDTGDKDMITRLDNQLTKQLKMCLTTRDHFKALGDVAGANRFERLALNVTKDLDIVRLAQRTPGAGIPKFHYEMKDFSIVKSFTELQDNDLELVILRGINYATTTPKEIDTYVKFSFPYPQDAPFCDSTSTVKDTNNPEYNQTFTIPIQRNQRACQRIFKRQAVKFEVYSKAGWFRSDNLLGTVSVKLQPLETHCEIHDSFDLLEGRKKVGGKLEVRLRLRHPIVAQEMEQLHEKWLVIDQ